MNHLVIRRYYVSIEQACIEDAIAILLHTMVRHIYNFSSDPMQITPRIPLHQTKADNHKEAAYYVMY